MAVRGAILQLAVFTISALLAIAGPAGAQQPFDHAGLARTALERHIRPGYERFKDAVTHLGRVLEHSCPARDAKRQSNIDAAFGRVVGAWGRIEHLQFGPVTKDNRLERILFWPDRRGLGARQIAKVLADRDPRVLDPEQLAKRSIALQGIGTLETVLYDDRAAFNVPAQAAHRCGFAKSIGKNLEQIAGEVVAGWAVDGTYARQWLSAGPGNAVFLTPTETTLALAKALDQGLEQVRDKRVAGPLGFNADRRKTPIILAPSDRSMFLVVANIEGLLDLFTNGGLKQAIIATKADAGTISITETARVVESELRTARDEAKRVARFRQPFSKPEARNQMIAMGFPLKNARELSVVLLTQAAGLTFGFNSSDGD